MLLGQSPGVLLAGTLVCGFGTGACFSLCMLLIGLRARNAADAARLSGMVQTVGYAVAAVGPPAMGALARCDRLVCTADGRAGRR